MREIYESVGLSELKAPAVGMFWVVDTDDTTIQLVVVPVNASGQLLPIPGFRVYTNKTIGADHIAEKVAKGEIKLTTASQPAVETMVDTYIIKLRKQFGCFD